MAGQACYSAIEAGGRGDLSLVGIEKRRFSPRASVGSHLPLTPAGSEQGGARDSAIPGDGIRDALLGITNREKCLERQLLTNVLRPIFGQIVITN